MTEPKFKPGRVVGERRSGVIGNSKNPPLPMDTSTSEVFLFCELLPEIQAALNEGQEYKKMWEKLKERLESELNGKPRPYFGIGSYEEVVSIMQELESGLMIVDGLPVREDNLEKCPKCGHEKCRSKNCNPHCVSFGESVLCDCDCR